VEFTAPVTISATTEAGANTVVTGTAVSYDGSTAIVVEFFAPYLETSATSGDIIACWLYDGASSIGLLAMVRTPAASANRVPCHAHRRLTPSNASHTYSIRASRTSANGSVDAGAGGNGNHMPGFIRITRAV
jgi:hypothetical protein